VLGFFGKLPEIHDFVHVRIGGAGWDSFEGWLTQAVAWHEAKREAAWRKHCTDRPPLAFVYRAPPAARAKDLLVGVIWPSTDAVGRRFPFVAFERIPEAEAARAPELLPFLAYPFQKALTDRAGALVGVDDPRGLEALCAGIAAPDMAYASQAAAAYAHWARSLGWWALWSHLYGPATPADMHGVLSMVYESVRVFVGQEAPPSSQLGLRLPLGRDIVPTTAFWIDLVRGMAKWRTTVLTTFVALSGPPVAMLQIGQPHVSSLTEAWQADPANDFAMDLTQKMAPYGTIPTLVARVGSADVVASALAAARM
jgi:type VI secretion system ImpM family protein